MTFLKMTDLALENKYVLIREDLNVPIENGKITSDARILAVIPTIEHCIRNNARIMILSHLGRPTEGQYDPNYSLKIVAERLGHFLGQPLKFKQDWLEAEKIDVATGEVVVLENVRFNRGESQNSPELSQKMAALCDIFVMDAFATAHRKEASTYGITQYAPIACAGPLLIAEIEALGSALERPKHPFVAIVGGSKVSSKLNMLDTLVRRVDQLIVGGGIANTFLAANGVNIGQSLYEPSLMLEAKRLLQTAKEYQVGIHLPTDVVVAKSFHKMAPRLVRKVTKIQADEQILDIGPESARALVPILTSAGTIIWNGPVGVFEWEAFSIGTKVVASAIAVSSAFSIAGGGDTLAAIDKYAISHRLSYISTGGGAFLAFLEGKILPALLALKERVR